MGSDITLYVEKKIDGKWVKQTGFKSDYYDKDDDYFGSDRFKHTDQPYEGRSYTVFSLLADFRNGYAIEPIAYPKGLPKDVSKEIKQETGEYDVNTSHLTLKELNVGRSFQTQITKCGIVDMYNYLLYKKTGHPNCWSGMVRGPCIHIVDNTRMNAAVRLATDEQKSKDFYSTSVPRYYTHIDWVVESNDEFKHFFDHVIPQLEVLSESSAQDDVRVVFWFDG